ncbi:MAG TPA: phosphoribosylanthranilate isomerase [Candidatus Binatia bacterium]
MVKVKVCGITNIDDAIKAVEFGADALGFNFYLPSPRYLAPEKAGAILHEVPSQICRVAVFVNEPREKVEGIVQGKGSGGGGDGFTALQFHGEEGPGYCRGWPVKVIKAFRVRDRGSLAGIRDYPADFYLLDSWSEGYGGSGSSFLWSWVEGLDADRLLLSGGLNLDNIERAVRQVRPFGVDVCSGVESRPGIKDHGKLKEFIHAAKGA